MNTSLSFILSVLTAGQAMAMTEPKPVVYPADETAQSIVNTLAALNIGVVREMTPENIKKLRMQNKSDVKAQLPKDDSDPASAI